MNLIFNCKQNVYNMKTLISYMLIFVCLSLLCCQARSTQAKQKKKDKEVQKQKLLERERKIVKLGQNHTFSLTKYQKPQSFYLEVSCKKPAKINFELSERLKRLHKNIYIDIDFQTNQCISTIQDPDHIVVDDQHWDLLIQNICCSKGNATKVFNQTITVKVKDGFKLMGFSIKTKVWNIVMPIITSLTICAFVWFSNFSQPRADNIGVLQRIYTHKHPKQDHNSHDQKHIQKNAQISNAMKKEQANQLKDLNKKES